MDNNVNGNICELIVLGRKYIITGTTLPTVIKNKYIKRYDNRCLPPLFYIIYYFHVDKHSYMLR